MLLEILCVRVACMWSARDREIEGERELGREEVVALTTSEMAE